MANELKILLSARLAKGYNKWTFEPGLLQITQTGSLVYDAVHSIATSEENISSFGDVGTEGVILLQNLDSTNYCQVGFATTVYGMRIRATRYAMFDAEPNLTLYLKANTAAVNMRVMCIEL